MNEVNVISMSGGKDSTAMALLAVERETPKMNHEEVLAFARMNKDKISLKPDAVIAELKELTKRYIERFGTRRERLEILNT
jgi:NH3-dependent NAD+ synthetase